MSFTFPKPVADAILGGWDLKLNTESLVRSAHLVRSDINHAVFEGVVWPGANSWTWWRCRVNAHNSKVRFWFQTAYGSRSRTAPTFKRDTIVATSEGMVPIVIETPSVADPVILHGQGVSLNTCEVDFETGSNMWLVLPGFEETDYVPRYATKTGGKWAYMGLDFPISSHDIDYWRKQLYPAGAYGGQFMHDNGKRVTEADVPDSVVSSHFHERAKDTGWIKYTDPNAPWKDRHAFGIREPDDQHNSIVDAISQAHAMWPEDEGFAMLVIRSAEFWLKAQPGRNKGTTHQYEGVGVRGPGRNLKSFTNMHSSLVLQNEGYLVNEIGKRALEMWDYQKSSIAWNIKDHGHMWSFYGDDLINPSEVGIYFWGLWSFNRYLVANGIYDPELHWVMEQTAKLCFDSWRDDWVTRPGQWGVPWTLDGKTFKPTSLVKPSSGHFAWLGAMHYDPTNRSEEDKQAGIFAAAPSEQKFRGDK